MAIKTINADKCIGCKKCIDVCPMDVFEWDNEEKQLKIINLTDCITCFNCELECPTKSLYVEPKRAKTVVFPW